MLRRALQRAEPYDLEVLSVTLEDLERGIVDGDLAAMVIADSSFHNAIARASQNRMFQAMFKGAHHLLIESQRASLCPPERRARVLTKHRAIFEAIVAGDALNADQAMRDHLMSFVSDMGVIDPSFLNGSR